MKLLNYLPKKNIDKTVLAVSIIFAVIFTVEFFRFVVPLYSFSRAVMLFIVMLLGYSYFSGTLQKLFLFLPRLYNSLKLEYKQIGEYESLLMQIGKNISKNKELLVYKGFILLFVVIFGSMILSTGNLLKYSVYGFIIVYTLVALAGFRLEKAPRRSEIKSMNSIRFFIVTYAFFLVITTLIFNSFSVEPITRKWLYVLFSLGYVTGGALLFFNLRKHLASLATPYNIMSAVLIILLITFLGYRNEVSHMLGFGDSEKTEQNIQEQMDLPGIISDEVQGEQLVSEQELISDEVTVDENNEEIIYTLVSEQYELPTGMAVGSVGENVSALQTVLSFLGYYSDDIDGEYDEATRVSLKDALITECEWPETTRGIFGPQAKDCIDNLEIPNPGA